MLLCQGLPTARMAGLSSLGVTLRREKPTALWPSTSKEHIIPLLGQSRKKQKLPSPGRGCTNTCNRELCLPWLHVTYSSQTPAQSIQLWHQGSSSQMTYPHLLQSNSSKLFAPDSMPASGPRRWLEPCQRQGCLFES